MVQEHRSHQIFLIGQLQGEKMGGEKWSGMYPARWNLERNTTASYLHSSFLFLFPAVPFRICPLVSCPSPSTSLFILFSFPPYSSLSLHFPPLILPSLLFSFPFFSIFSFYSSSVIFPCPPSFLPCDTITFPLPPFSFIALLSIRSILSFSFPGRGGSGYGHAVGFTVAWWCFIIYLLGI